ncbi:MAG: FtsK/SpoIIIE domain-containing protein [Chloroflexota bacterium]
MELTDTRIGIISFAFMAGLIATQTLIQAGLITALVVGLMLAYVRGWLTGILSYLGPLVWRLLAWLRSFMVKPVDEEALYDRYDILLGRDPLTGTPDVENLSDLQHVGVYGTTRFGKTTWLRSILHHLISHHRPSELRLVISDPKQLDYAIYSNLSFLMCPIAKNRRETAVVIEMLITEMEQRQVLFGEFATRDLCDNLDRYIELSGQQLPRVVAIFDELADVVEPGSKAEADLIRLAKMGLAFGIQLILGTQRPSSKVVTGEIKSQMSSKLVTWMPTSREYGVVAEIPKEMYQEMPRQRGRFMAYTSKGWRFMQGRQVPDRQLVALARRMSGRPRRWPSTPAGETAVSPSPEWDGGDEDKMELIRQFAAELHKRPSINETAERFDVSRPTAIKYLKMTLGEAEG